MKAFYSDHFVLPLPEGHRFPMAKYSMLRNKMTTAIQEVQMLEAPAASDGELARKLKGRLDFLGRRPWQSGRFDLWALLWPQPGWP
jgi:hypothetical protein